MMQRQCLIVPEAGDAPQVSDNSGAKLVQCIQKSGTQWTIGDIITVAVKRARGGKVCCLRSAVEVVSNLFKSRATWMRQWR